MGRVGDAADMHRARLLLAIYHHGTVVQRVVVALLSAHDHLQLGREEIKTYAVVGPCVDPCLWPWDVGRWSVPNAVQFGQSVVLDRIGAVGMRRDRCESCGAGHHVREGG